MKVSAVAALMAFAAPVGAVEPVTPAGPDTKCALARLAASLKPATWAMLKVAVFGGGTQAAPPWANFRKWYLLVADGKVTPLDDAPVSGKHLLNRPNDFDYKKTTGLQHDAPRRAAASRTLI